MTVAELIEQLKDMPQDLTVYAEGECADKVIVEEFEGVPQIVRIFKAWDIDFVLGSAGLSDHGNDRKEQTDEDCD